MPLLTMKQIMADSVRLATSADAKPEDRYAVGAFNFSTIPEMVDVYKRQCILLSMEYLNTLKKFYLGG